MLITREKLNNLSYSVNDVYRMAESCKYKNVKQVHNQLFQLNGRLTWKQIMEQYPDTWVGLTDIQWENESNIESAIVKYTDKTKSELLRMVVNNEIEFSCYTTPDNIFQLGIIGVIKR